MAQFLIPTGWNSILGLDLCMYAEIYIKVNCSHFILVYVF
ncbi:hypothetical protein FB480_102123 [Agrobacterium vitis]|nr:hypothetical protein FB480_102123 [Agrobacterium vitis]